MSASAASAARFPASGEQVGVGVCGEAVRGVPHQLRDHGDVGAGRASRIEARPWRRSCRRMGRIPACLTSWENLLVRRSRWHRVAVGLGSDEVVIAVRRAKCLLGRLLAQEVEQAALRWPSR